ncbi:GNAT family N-acetyltransferase [Halobacillus yeomjeoni]|uniref:GNAT family N-acetyltransferase n=1 Tax=Halobacillus yeomjeoni TaxID=311194 RepID=UPI001CD1AE53|nr:GNAT family N-acetyltransferase [Halobacillus yeomjeoni]MCA0983121.1 GNAT family N-acetyltransferase [Halobacillus yeomjeoni]
MIKLVPLEKENYDLYIKDEIQRYADEKVKAGTWHAEEAINNSKDVFDDLLPEGQETKQHYFMSIQSVDTKESEGYIWYHFNTENPQKEAFIYNFYIIENARDKGKGSVALQELEEYVRQQGAAKLSLHVFAHNHRAVHLYEKMKFRTTDIMMSKDL